MRSEISAAGVDSLPTWAMQCPYLLLPSQEQGTCKITTQTSTFPIFYLAQPQKNQHPFPYGQEISSNRGDTSCKTRGGQAPPGHGASALTAGRAGSAASMQNGVGLHARSPLGVCTFLPGADRGGIAPAGWEKVETLLKIWPAAS